MTSKLVEEILADSRIMPPLAERIRIRDEHLAKQRKLFKQSEPIKCDEIDPYAGKQSGDYTGD